MYKKVKITSNNLVLTVQTVVQSVFIKFDQNHNGWSINEV